MLSLVKMYSAVKANLARFLRRGPYSMATLQYHSSLSSRGGAKLLVTDDPEKWIW